MMMLGNRSQAGLPALAAILMTCAMAAMQAQTTTNTPPNTTTEHNKPNTTKPATKPPAPPPSPKPAPPPPKPAETQNPAPKGNGAIVPKITLPGKPSPPPTGANAPHPNLPEPNSNAGTPRPAGSSNPHEPDNPYAQPSSNGANNVYHPPATHAGASAPQVVHPANNGILGKPAPAGARTQFLTNGNAIQRRPNGQMSDVLDTRHGMSIHNGLEGGRRITTVRPDGTRIVSTGSRAGFVEKPFTAGGRQLSERTYTQNGVTNRQFYQQTTYQGVPIHVYTPAHYYPPATYGWVYHAPVLTPPAGAGAFSPGALPLPGTAAAPPPGAMPAPPGAIVTPSGTVVTPNGTVLTPSGAIIAPNGNVIAPGPSFGQQLFGNVSSWLTSYVTCAHPALGQIVSTGMSKFGQGQNGAGPTGGYSGGQNPNAASQSPYTAGQSGNQSAQNPYASPQSSDQSGQNPYTAGQSGNQSAQNPYASPQSSDQSSQNPYTAGQSGNQSAQNPYASPQSSDQSGQNPYGGGQSGYGSAQGAVPQGPGNPCPQLPGMNAAGGNQNAPNPNAPANPYTGDQGQNASNPNPAAPANPYTGDQGQAAGQNPTASGAPASGPVLSPDVQEQVANEIKNQVALENAEAAQNAQGQTPDPASSGVARMLGDGQQHVFVVDNPLDVVDASGSECALGAGDVLKTVAPPAPTDKTASLTVLASNPNECALSDSVAVGFDDLQEMQNHMRQMIDQGLDTIQQNQGQPGVPAAPPAAAAAPAPAAFAPLAPPPDPNATGEVNQQNQQANQAVAQAAAQAPPQ